MVDPTWFKTRTRIPRQPKAMIPVPHGGLKTLYGASYAGPSDVKLKENNFCAVDTPWVLPRKYMFNSVLLTLIGALPHKYMFNSVLLTLIGALPRKYMFNSVLLTLIGGVTS